MTPLRSLPTLALLVLAAATLSAQRPAERRCLVSVEHADRDGVRQDNFGSANYYFGGNVRMRCVGENIHWRADSMAALGGEYYQLITSARYQDDDITVDADTINYIRASETLQARGNVVITNRVNGSTLTGPSVDYLRPVKSIGRDSAEMNALGRPTVRYRRAGADSGDGYTVTGNRLRTYGSSRMSADGDVEVVRDDLVGRGDSLRYLTDSILDNAILLGAPARLLRSGEDSLDVKGNQIHLGVSGEELRSLRAQGGGRVSSASGIASGDNVLMIFEDELLQSTAAWGREERGMVIADGREVTGDSVMVVSPRERISSVEAVGQAVMREPLAAADSVPPAADSVARADGEGEDEPIRNTLTGQRIIARFADRDSAGVIVSRVIDILATGNATSLFAREVMRDGLPSPTINYTRADTILVLMKDGDSTGVAEVRAVRGANPVDGVQLERASLRRPAARREDPR